MELGEGVCQVLDLFVELLLHLSELLWAEAVDADF